MTEITRRALLGSAAGITLATSFGWRANAQGSNPPNILFIMADDFGYADASSYGSVNNKTPNIDRLAAEGVRFTQAYSNSPVCSATRTALITGRYQYRLEIGLEEPLGPRPVGLPPEMPTLPSLLRKIGYGTSLIGKWHLGLLPDYGPLMSGYDHFFGIRGGGVDYYSHGWGDKPDLWDGDAQVDETGYLTELLGDRTVGAIGDYAEAKQPFFISLHFTAPHWPWVAPGDVEESKHANETSLFHFDGGTLETYRLMVESMDQQIGRVLKALDDAGVADNTIVVFTSDNGGERFSNTWPFTGKKTELLEGGIRVPAVVRWPAKVPGGRVHDQVLLSLDWLPTLLAAAGSAPDSAYPSDGISVLPALTDNAAPVSRTVFWRFKAHGQRAVRDGDAKALRIGDNDFLFDVVKDPLERANLKDRDPETYKRLVGLWRDWNKTMLPEIAETDTHGFDASQLADHFGAKAPGPKTPSSNAWEN